MEKKEEEPKFIIERCNKQTTGVLIGLKTASIKNLEDK